MGYDKESLLLSGFSIVRNAAISGHNTKHLTNASVGVCKTECQRYSWCKSFDYYERQEKGQDGRRRRMNTASRQITMAGAPSDGLIAPDVPNLGRRRVSKED